MRTNTVLGGAKSCTYPLSTAGDVETSKARGRLTIETKVVYQGNSGGRVDLSSAHSDGREGPLIRAGNPSASPHSDAEAESLEPMAQAKTSTASIRPTSHCAQNSVMEGDSSATQTTRVLVEDTRDIAKPETNETISAVNEKMPTLSPVHVGVIVDQPSMTRDIHMDDVGVKSTTETSEQTIQRASDAVDRMKSPKIPNTPEGTGETVDVVESVGSIVILLLDKMQRFSELMDHLSEVSVLDLPDVFRAIIHLPVDQIHPYASAAWKVISAVPKVAVDVMHSVNSYDLTVIPQLLKDQIEQDENIRDLCVQMNKLYDRVHRLVDSAGQDGLPDIAKRQRKILLRVSQQANDCAYFIVDYCKSSFGTFGQPTYHSVKASPLNLAAKRTLAHIYSGEAGRKLQEYKTAFERLEKEFDAEVVEETHLIVTLAFKDVAALGKAVDNLSRCSLLRLTFAD